MRQAPPVQVCCSSAGWAAFQSVCGGLAAAALMAWGGLHADLPGMQTLAGALFSFLLVATLGWLLWRRASDSLVWNGQVWLLNEEDGQLDLTLDLGTWLLLRWHGAHHGRVRWLAVSASSAGPVLHGLRAALYAHAPAPRAGTNRPVP